MKKKLLTALLVGAMALNITACGGSSDAAAPADNDQQTTTTDTAADDAADTEEDAVDVEDCRLPRLLTQQGLTTIERVNNAG